MAEVDPDDDGIDRFVVFHYRFDPARNERRNVVVAAFDDVGEWEARIEREHAALAARQAAGEADAVESISGVAKPAGYTAAARERRAVWRSIRRRQPPSR